MVAHQTQNLCMAQLQTDLRVQVLQSQVDFIAEKMQVAAEAANQSAGQFDSLKNHIEEKMGTQHE